MYWLIESESQLNIFLSKNFNEAFLEIIPLCPTAHPVNNGISGVYIKPLHSNKGYIFSIYHSESFPLHLSQVENILSNFNKLYVRDKKEVLHYLPLQNLFDITLNKSIEVEYTFTHSWFSNKYGNVKNINTIIPLSKHYEYCENLFNSISNNITKPINPFFNNKASLVYNTIERSGLKIDTKKFEEYFYKPNSEYVYTQYNFKTLTRRPSNTFNKVNYAALNKSNHERESIIPRNDILLEIDINAYHPALISNLIINYDFKGEEIHSYFSKLYGVSYKESKQITFQQLYGGVFSKYKHLEFFKKTDSFINNLWEEYQKVGYVTVPISNWALSKENLIDMNPQKLFNYYLQSLETSMNVIILWDILKLLRGCKTKLILVTYDSFTFDYDQSESHILDKIKEIFKQHKFNIKINSGLNYDF